MAEVEDEDWPPVHRTFDAAGVKAIATVVRVPSIVLRLYSKDSPFYDRLTLAIPRKDGREIFLMGAVEPLPSRARWRAAKAELFPDATVATFERLEPDGTIRLVHIPI